MLAIIVIVPLVLIVADALIARAGLRLRSRAVSQDSRRAWDVARPSDGPWRPLGESLVERSEVTEDLSQLLSRPARRPAPMRSQERR